jgi:hypothetical protein
MRSLAIVGVFVVALGQAQRLGSIENARITAGARDIIVPIEVKPTPLGGDLLSVMLMADGVRIEIELPGGRRITQANANSFDFKWEVAPQAHGDAVLAPGLWGKVNNFLFLPAGVPAGKWLIHADASALRQDTILGAIFVPIGWGQPHAVNAVIEEKVRSVHYSGEQVELVTSVSENGTPIANTRLAASVVPAGADRVTPTGPPAPLVLRPKGDGTFLTELPMTAAGNYRITLHATGKRADGQNFNEGMSMSVTITQRLVKLVSIVDRGVDVDGNGKIDRVDVAVRANVVIPNRYSIQVDLKTRSGRETTAFQDADLAKGDATLTASFDREELLRLDEDGPYTIRVGIAEKKKDGLRSVFTLSEMTATSRPYVRSTFDPGPIYFTGTAHATPQSASGQSPFDKMALTFDVVTPGGNCEWYSSLGGNGTATTVESSQGRLPAGASRITIVFDSYAMHKLEAGLVQTRPTHVSCGNLEAWLEKPYALPLFPRGTFLNSGPEFELSSGRPEIIKILDKEFLGHIEIRAHDDFEEPIQISVDRLPAGVAIPDLPTTAPAQKRWGKIFHVTVAASVPAGRYQITIRARYKITEHVLKCTLVVP